MTSSFLRHPDQPHSGPGNARVGWRLALPEPEPCNWINHESHEAHENGGSKGGDLTLGQETDWCVEFAERTFAPPAFCPSVFLSCGSCISWFTRILPAEPGTLVATEQSGQYPSPKEFNVHNQSGQ